eukprot:495935-Amphidinium_carterae.2
MPFEQRQVKNTSCERCLIVSRPSCEDPAEKKQRSAAADGRVYFSYAHIHSAVSSLAAPIQAV